MLKYTHSQLMIVSIFYEVHNMKLWIDDVRPAPEGFYMSALSVNTAIKLIEMIEFRNNLNFTDGNVPDDFKIELIDIGHNAGNYAYDGGHYIKLLEWLEETGRNYPIHIHSDNQINLLWMREIIERNGWKEV